MAESVTGTVQVWCRPCRLMFSIVVQVTGYSSGCQVLTDRDKIAIQHLMQFHTPDEQPFPLAWLSGPDSIQIPEQSPN